MPLRVRSLVGLLPLIAVDLLDHEITDQLPRFSKRLACAPREPLGDRAALVVALRFRGSRRGDSLRPLERESLAVDDGRVLGPCNTDEVIGRSPALVTVLEKRRASSPRPTARS